jgi:hypothetical protein
MTQPTPHVRSKFALLIALAASALSACSGGISAEPANPPTPVPSIATARTEVACLDVTTSVPLAFDDAARDWFAHRVADAVPGAMEAATFYLRVTTSASYSSEDGLREVELPEVPAPPAPPDLPGNPYEAGKKAALEKAHAEDLAAWQADLDAARARAVEQADAIRSVPLPRDDRGTDLLGCAIKASELLGPDGNRTLFVASDLIPSGPQQLVTPDLRGVQVIIAFWCIDDAATCVARRDAFTSTVDAAGAASIDVLDPQQLD